MVVLKTRHSLENNPSGHNEHPERYSRKKEKKKKTVYIGISWNVKGARREVCTARTRRTSCGRVPTGI